MVISCCAYNCTNRQGGAEKLSFHKFPLKNEELCKKWIQAVGRGNWSPSNYSFICSAHFKEEDYKTEARSHLLDSAVPSVFNFPLQFQEVVKKCRLFVKQEVVQKKKTKVTEAEDCCLDTSDQIQSEEKLKYNEDVHRKKKKVKVTETEDCCLDTPDLIQSEEKLKYNKGVKKKNFNVTETEDRCVDTSDLIQLEKKPTYIKRIGKLKDTNAKLRRKVKMLQQQLKRRDKKILSLHESLASVKDSTNDMSEDVICMMTEKFGHFPLDLLMSEIKNSQCKASRIRYSKVMKEFAVTLYCYSPKCYNYVRNKGFHLPHPSLIRSWKLTVNSEPGCLEEARVLTKENEDGKNGLNNKTNVLNLSECCSIVEDKEVGIVTET